MRECLEHLIVGEREATSADHVKCSCCCSFPQSNDLTANQEHSKAINYSDGTCSDSRNNKSTGISCLVFTESKKAPVMETFCNCKTTCKAIAEDNKLQWRKHVLSFGCLIKAR